MKQLTSEQINLVVEGFISTLREDQHLTLQETNNALLAYDVSLTLEQVATVGCFIADLLKKLDLDSWDYERTRQGLLDLGGEIYIGFMYDSYETPLMDASFNYSAEVYSWADDDDQTLARVEGYFCINGLMYHL